MPMTVPFVRDIKFDYGVVDQVSSLIRRMAFSNSWVRICSMRPPARPMRSPPITKPAITPARCGGSSAAHPDRRMRSPSRC